MTRLTQRDLSCKDCLLRPRFIQASCNFTWASNGLINLRILQSQVICTLFSNYSFIKMKNWSFLGPIDNSDFLCRHGGVLPQKSEYVYDLCLAFPQSIWELLQSQFGGGPPCTRLFECSQCRSDYDSLVKQKSFELEEFKRLHAEFKVINLKKVLFDSPNLKTILGNIPIHNLLHFIILVQTMGGIRDRSHPRRSWGNWQQGDCFNCSDKVSFWQSTQHSNT